MGAFRRLSPPQGAHDLALLVLAQRQRFDFLQEPAVCLRIERARCQSLQKIRPGSFCGGARLPGLLLGFNLGRRMDHNRPGVPVK